MLNKYLSSIYNVPGAEILRIYTLNKTGKLLSSWGRRGTDNKQ